jgi:nitrite reductase (NADH) large subunit
MTSPSLSFPNYTEVVDRVPQWFWYLARIITVGIGLGLIMALFVRPELGLFIFWKLIVPFLPIIFFVIPGVWRNICPMAALNQVPRLFNFSRAMTLPKWAKEYAYVLGIILFFVIVPSRKVLFNNNGAALALLLLTAFGTAFIGGFFFKGKSGWCSSICPLLPVQRLYGQTPFVNVPNNHCKPCVGCAKNCFDFNPHIANLADQYDNAEQYRGYRKFFAAAFPGLVLAFYVVPDAAMVGAIFMYTMIALCILLSVGLYYALDTFSSLSAPKLSTLFAAAALNIYYLFNIPAFFGETLQGMIGMSLPIYLQYLLHLLVLGITIWWIYRSFRKEPQFLSQSAASQPNLRANASLMQSIAIQRSRVLENIEVAFEPDGKRILAAQDSSLLDLAEANQLDIEAGCRMGVCGADPVAILEGMDNLSPVSSSEKGTLERLGFADNTRMACCARVQKGQVKVALKPEKAKVKQISMVANFSYDTSVKRVVIIGNGIAGITAADHIRRRHPSAEIHVVAKESHHLYNRMGLSRLIYGRSAMKGLYLLAEDWYEDYHITTSLNTLVTKIDLKQQVVALADGELLYYDRLILAVGSSGRVPRVDGMGMEGSFVLREADDAMKMRAFAQKNFCKKAVVAGGGLLGLEAAYALHKLGLEVTVLERGSWLMRRQLDERAAQFLWQYLNGIGINVLLDAEVDSLQGTQRVKEVSLKDGRLLFADIFLACAGIVPNVQLAKDAGIEVNQGVLVNERMQTSDPNVYAVGDAVEYEGMVHGLWPVAVEQGQVAAINIAGGNASYTPVVPTTMLKVAGIDLMSIGDFEPRSDEDMVILLEDSANDEYRKLLISNGKIIGALMIGFPRLAPIVNEAIKAEVDVTLYMPDLQAGDWEVLKVAMPV